MILIALVKRLLPLALVVIVGWAFVRDAAGVRTWIEDVIVGYVSDSINHLAD